MLADRKLLSAAVTAAILASASNADAFCRTRTVPVPAAFTPAGDTCFDQGAPLYHPSQCVTYRLADVPDGVTVGQPDLAAAAARAFATWSAPNASCVPGISVLEVTGGAAPTVIAEYVMNGANQNVVGVVPAPWPHGDGGNTLALTTLTFNATTGAVFDADMELNGGEKLSSAKPLPMDGYDLDTIVLHEAGHFLGLAHSPLPSATMFASYSPGSSDVTLDPDDVAGICAIYPSRAVRTTATGEIASTACELTAAAAPGSTCDPVITNGCSTSPRGPGALVAGSSSGTGAWEAVAVVLAGLGLVRAGSRRRARPARTRT